MALCKHTSQGNPWVFPKSECESDVICAHAQQGGKKRAKWWVGLELQMAFVCSFLFVLALFSWTCMARAAHCNVKDYGAKGDGKSNDTESFIIAVQACTAAGRAMYVCCW